MKIIEPVYLLKGKTTRSILFIVEVSKKSYGLFKLPALYYKDKPKPDHWTYKIMRLKGQLYLQITPELELFDGELVTQTKWHKRFKRCDANKINMIQEYVDNLNNKGKKNDNK